jgi:MFS family permease
MGSIASEKDSDARDGSTPRGELTSAALPQAAEGTKSADYFGTPAEAPPSEQEVQDLARPNSALALLRVFRHRNYRLFFFGQLVTFMGTFVQMVAQGWLVYSMTHSSLLLGVTSFCSLVPGFFLSPIAGTLSDRVDRRKVLIATRLVAMLQATLLAALTLTGLIQVWHIIGLALMLGLVNGFDVPTRQAFVVDMVGRDDLRHAISLNSVMFNLARIVGPTIGGLLVAATGEGICFALNAVAAGAVLSSYFRMDIAPAAKRQREHPFDELKEGFRYAWRVRQIRVALLLVAASSMFGAAYLTLMPAIARSVLHEGPHGLGFLMASVGVGALIGAYALARIPDRLLPKTPLIASAAFGVSLVLFSQSHMLAISMLLAMPVAFFLVLLGGSSNTIVQTVAEERLRGRVVSLYIMSAMGMMPWGSLLLGWLGSRIGVSNAVLLGGCVCIVASAIAWFDATESAGRNQRQISSGP